MSACKHVKVLIPAWVGTVAGYASGSKIDYWAKG